MRPDIADLFKEIMRAYHIDEVVLSQTSTNPKIAKSNSKGQ